MKNLRQAISEGSCLLNLDARSMEEIIRATIEFLVQSGRLPEADKETIVSGLLQRERMSPTVLGHACAVPHFLRRHHREARDRVRASSTRS